MRNAWTDAGEGLRYVLDLATLFLDPSASPALEASNALNLAFLVLFVVLICAGLFVLRLGLYLYTLVVTLLPVLTLAPSFPLMRLPHFMLSAFPLFLVLGYLFSRSRPALILWLLVSGAVGVALTAMFVTWRWVA